MKKTPRRQSLYAALGVALMAPAVVGAPTYAADPTPAPWQSRDPIFAAPSDGPQIRGTIYHGLWNINDDNTRRTTLLNRLSEAGTPWVRLDVSWAELQPHPPSTANGGWDVAWALPRLDSRIRELNARGIKVLLMLYWGPSWSTGTTGNNGVPSNPDDYGKAAAYVAQRYNGNRVPGAKVEAMELWNEPNLAAFLSNTSPATHARLLRAAYPKIKAVNPALTVVAGSNDQINDRRLSGDNWAATTWWDSVYAELKKTDPTLSNEYFDAVGIHPYPGKADKPPSYCEAGAVQYYMCDIPNLLTILRNNGDGNKKLWATEYGWSSHANTYDSGGKLLTANWNRGVTEQQQAQYIVDMQSELAKYKSQDGSRAVEAAFLYTSANPSAKTNPSEVDVQQENFGFLTYSLARKPAFWGFKCAVSGVCGPGTARPLIRASAAGWKVNDTGESLGTAWRLNGYSDGWWKSVSSEFGYGDGDEASTISYGSNAANKIITTYARHKFDAGTTVAGVKSLRLRALVDDGAVIYLNGTEIWRFNMPSGAVNYKVLASRYIAGGEERTWREAVLPVTALQSGTNTLAVEVHQDRATSTDLSLNLELTAQN